PCAPVPSDSIASPPSPYYKGKKAKSATPLGVKGETPGGVAFYGCTAKRFMVVQLKGLWLYNYRVYGRTTKGCMVVQL
uniref:hypothetical protein n=1 Tax=Prevotella sp. TaxID=59823 RepID=UPI0040283484